ncbi:MAG: hypothetical protein WC861_02570 [Candidatus Micrarchaeia archaeon]|jgi:uncharacterized protein (DUF736 family)
MGGSGDGEMPGKEATPAEEEGKTVVGQKPDFRIVQPEYVPALGKTVYKDVGAMWHNVSKSGNEFYTLKIGKLKLLVFQNTK